jgi:glycine/D-amino acid oxidase-like deaminating enzyme
MSYIDTDIAIIGAGQALQGWAAPRELAGDFKVVLVEQEELLVSSAEEIPVEPHDLHADDLVLAEGLYRFEQAVDVPVTRVEWSWAGLRTFASDRTPVAGFDGTAENFFWPAGQGGYGIQTAPALSHLAGQSIRRATLPSNYRRWFRLFRRTGFAAEHH